MELVLESKNDNNSSNQNFYSFYSLKVNRQSFKSKPILSDLNSRNKTSVSQFLEKEATINKDFSLTLIQNTVPSENENYLRENLARKIEKGTLYASNTGYISVFQLKNELDFYFENYLDSFLNEKDLVSNKIFEQLLVDWYENTINYISRSFNLLGEEKLSILIDEALTCGSLELSGLDPRTSRDLNILFKSFNSSYLLLTSDNSVVSNKKAIEARNPVSKLIISYENDKKTTLMFSKKESSKFANECAKNLIKNSLDECNPFKDKQELENYKLKLAQELNTFNRLLTKAQYHYYDLYKLYLYLKHSPLSQTLVHMHENSSNMISQELIKVFNVVAEFYMKQKNLNMIN